MSHHGTEIENPLSPMNAVRVFLSERPDVRFTARAIATWMVDSNPEESKRKMESSSRVESFEALVGQVVGEIGRDRWKLQQRYPQIKTTEGRPRQYYWTEKSDQEEVTEAEESDADTGYRNTSASPKESDLYPVLSEYLLNELQVYSMRIDEKKSHNTSGRGGNKWLHPDLAGMENLTAGWHEEIKKLHRKYRDKKARLWSFEVKKILNRSNVREAFFQAVSNSSWANLGYLVVAEIAGEATMRELRMLSSLHGIGLIRIDFNNPAEGQILIPGRERAEIDWATCDRLSQENQDFLGFLRRVREFHQTGNARPTDWDFQLDE